MTQYVKIPKERVGVIIGPKGETKKFIEDKTACQLEIDSGIGKIDITCEEDPLKEFRVLETLKAIEIVNKFRDKLNEIKIEQSDIPNKN